MEHNSEFSTPPSSRGVFPLHQAVREGRLDEVQSLLDKNHDVNERDGSGNTPLLLAVCVKDEGTYTRTVGLLIDHGADVNVSNKGFTPLYNAVFYKREASVRLLLKAGAWLRPGTKTELHLLAELGGSNILRLILQDIRCTPDVLNARDDEGRSPLHVAAQYLHKNCLCMLIEKGGDLIAANNDEETVIDVMFETFTNPCRILTEVLDSKIAMSCSTKYRCHYDIDFRTLASPSSPRQMKVISNALAAAPEAEKIELLQHPVVELFLVLKWNKIRHFFYLWIFVYSVFAASMSVKVVFDKEPEYLQNVEGFLRVVDYVVILSSSGLLIHAIIQCALIRRNFLGRFEIWANLACTGSALTVTIASLQGSRAAWISQTTSVTILLAWFELMLLIGRLPSLGHYALMFAAVLHNVVKVLLAFVFLVVGFSLSFSIQFSNNNHFGNPFTSVIKTLIMMTGEYDYTDLYKTEHKISVVSHLIFLTFVIFGSIVLMNLMIGLAVSDIQDLRTEGHARNLEKQAEFLNQLEEVLSSKQLNSRYTPEFVKKLLVRRSFIDLFYELGTSIEFQRSQRIPRNVIDRVVGVAKARMNKREN